MKSFVGKSLASGNGFQAMAQEIYSIEVEPLLNQSTQMKFKINWKFEIAWCPTGIILSHSTRFPQNNPRCNHSPG